MGFDLGNGSQRGMGERQRKPAQNGGLGADLFAFATSGRFKQVECADGRAPATSDRIFVRVGIPLARASGSAADAARPGGSYR